MVSFVRNETALINYRQRFHLSPNHSCMKPEAQRQFDAPREPDGRFKDLIDRKFHIDRKSSIGVGIFETSTFSAGHTRLLRFER